MPASSARCCAAWALSRFDVLDAFLVAHAHLSGFDFLAACSAHLGLALPRDQDRPGTHFRAGRLLVVVNHPSAALDALALLVCIGRVRRDVRIVANDLLTTIAPCP